MFRELVTFILFTMEAEIYLNSLNRFRYSEGGTPVIFLNCLLKWLMLLNPLSRHTSNMPRSLFINNLHAKSVFILFRYSNRVIPMFILKYRHNEPSAILTSAASLFR